MNLPEIQPHECHSGVCRLYPEPAAAMVYDEHWFGICADCLAWYADDVKIWLTAPFEIDDDADARRRHMARHRYDHLALWETIRPAPVTDAVGDA